MISRAPPGASAKTGVIGIEGRVYFPHSLGIFYQAMTQYLGFHTYGDEYKVMGLAAYGAPLHIDAMRQIVRLRRDGGFRLDLRFFRHHREHVAYEWRDGAPDVGQLYTPALEALLGPARRPDGELTEHHRNIARSTQERFEEAVFHILDTIHSRHGIDALALAGGCAFNSVANGRIRTNTPYRRVFVQPAAGDAGGAIGAAFALWQELSSEGRTFVLDRADWGPGYDAAAIAAALNGHADELSAAACTTRVYDDEDALCRHVAATIADGGVVGWFQGRMEWGPRALGHRSILCDPRRADIRDVLNAKIKRRESFRPFAPSILREAVTEWFEVYDDVPFMQKVYPVRMDRRALIPAVTHVDGSGRLQTVHKAASARYYRLIEAFGELTDVPMLLNTSFNENEPVVCRPAEALNCFLRTHMDMLVMENTVIGRADAAATR